MGVYWCCCDERDFIYNAQFTILPRLGNQAVQLVINAFDYETFSQKSYDPCIGQAVIERPYVEADATSQEILLPGHVISDDCDMSDVTFRLRWLDGLNADIGAHADSSGPGAALFHGAVDQTGGSKNMVATLDVVDEQPLRNLDPVLCEIWKQLHLWLPMKLSPWFARTNDLFPLDPDLFSWGMGWSGPLVIEQFCVDTNKPDPDNDDSEVPRTLQATVAGVALGHTPVNMTEDRVAAINGTVVALFRTHDEVPCTIHGLHGWGGGALTGGINSEGDDDVLTVALAVNSTGQVINFASLSSAVGSQRTMAGVRVGLGGDTPPGNNGNWAVDDLNPFACKIPTAFWNNHTNLRTDPGAELDFSDATISISL